MTNYQNLRKLFLYGGIEKDEYQKLRPEIRKENRGLLCVFSQIASAMFLLLLAASIVAKGFASENTTTYLACAVEMLVILFCSHVVLPKHPALVTPLVYVFEILLYAFGIHVSMLHADMPAVSAVAFLLVSPMLFYDRPVRMSVLIAAVVALFCAIVLRCKQPEVAQKDVWNMITFGMVAVAVTVFTMSVKMRALLQSRQIEYLSQTDLLTGAKNRNHYENRLQTYPDMCRSNLACVYADVNGLHEMNNRYGHPAGDKMLREVAEAMQRCFGAEHTYRLGGDEFAAFRADAEPAGLSAEVDRLQRELESKGYHVSFGIAVREKTQGALDMRELVSVAETGMFAAKQAFYRRAENDRRER